MFFDALGIKYEYEAEGYDLGKVGWYLPDFFMRRKEPYGDFFVEIKPVCEHNEKCEALAESGKRKFACHSLGWHTKGIY